MSKKYTDIIQSVIIQINEITYEILIATLGDSKIERKHSNILPPSKLLIGSKLIAPSKNDDSTKTLKSFDNLP